MDHLVTVRKLEPSEFPRTWLWIKDVRGAIFADNGPRSQEDMFEWLSTWPIVHVAEIRGETMAIVPCRFIPGTEVLEAQLILKRETWRPAVCRWIVLALFNACFTNAQKIEIAGFPGNSNFLRMLRDFGAVEEARLRERVTRNGKPDSIVVMGLLKRDFDAWVPEKET